jgi:hypothetical protein
MAQGKLTVDFVRHSPKGYSFGMKAGLYFVDLEPIARDKVLEELWEAFTYSATSHLQVPPYRSTTPFERMLRLIKQAESGKIIGFREDLLVLTGCCKFLDGIVGWQHVTDIRSDEGIFERAFDLAISMGEIHDE